MTELVVSCVISFFVQLITLGSAYRMDKYLKPLKFFPRIKLGAFHKNLLVLFKKHTRGNFLLYSIVLEYICYFFALTIAALLIAALIIANGDFSFFVALVSFSMMGLSVVIHIFEMVMLTFFQNKNMGEEYYE